MGRCPFLALFSVSGVSGGADAGGSNKLTSADRYAGERWAWRITMRSREIPSFGRRPYSGVRVQDCRENALDRGQHLLRVNDTLVGGLRSLDGSVEDPHHGHDRDDGQHSRSAKCA